MSKEGFILISLVLVLVLVGESSGSAVLDVNEEPNDYYTIIAHKSGDPNTAYWQLKVDVQDGGIFNFQDLTDDGDGQGGHTSYTNTDAYGRQTTLLYFDGRGGNVLTRTNPVPNMADKLTFAEGGGGSSFTIKYEETSSTSGYYHDSYSDGDRSLSPGDLLTTITLVIKPPAADGTFWDWTCEYENVCAHDLSAKIWAADEKEMWLWDDIVATTSSETSMIDSVWNPSEPNSYTRWTIGSNPSLGLTEGRKFTVDSQVGLAGHEAGGGYSTGSWAGYDYILYGAGFDYDAEDALGPSEMRTDSGQFIINIAGEPDTTAPTPDPMTWATDPYATGDSSISMTATTATDSSGAEYYFECTAGGGHNSGWQASATYEDTSLSPTAQYTYKVKARDKSTNQNQTAYSTTKSATTDASDTTPPSPDPMTWATEPYATGSSSISMTATTAADVSGVQYYFDCTTTGGHDSSWQDSATYEDIGLSPDTQYTYKVKARDKSTNQNETGYSTSKSATTNAGSIGTTYYIDFDSGSDNNNGTSTSTPFKHCPGDDNATGVPAGTSLLPGDSVLFNGGVYYRGTFTCNWSGSAGRPITYSTYGSGRGIIDGSESITGWTQCQSADDCGGNPNWQNIYTSTVSPGTDVFIANMYEDDQMLWPSQDPNLDDPFYYDDLATFRSIHSDNVTRTSVTDPSYFTQSDPDYWNGAFLLLWGNPSIVRTLKITGYVPAENKVQFADTGSNSLYTDRTVYYAIANHLLKLNTPGEYVVNEQTNTIYLWPRAGGDISQKQITLSHRRVGININGRDYVTIEGLKIQKHTSGFGEWNEGIAVRDYYSGNSNVVIRNNVMTMNHSMERQGVINLYGGTNITIEDNSVYENPKNRGILLNSLEDSVCRNNYLRKNGGTAIDFYRCVDSNMIGNTVLDHTGMHANGLTLYIDCNNCEVAYNVVYNGNTALTTQDSNSITISYNILHTNVEGLCVADWTSGGKNSANLHYYNNVIMHKTATTAFATGGEGLIVKNNIIDGVGVDNVSNWDNFSYNIYTALSWSQHENYGWSLGVGEIIEPDKTNIFVDPLNRDFHILPEGPAADAGTDVGFDRDIQGTFVPLGSAPDIGAYEYFVPPIGDFNGDGVVDFEDLKILTDDWLLSDDDLAGTLSIDLVSHYKFDGDATDSVGGNDGTELGEPTYTSGLYNQAIDLDGTDDYVDCGNDSSFEITDSITLSALIKGTFNNNWDGIITKGYDWQLTKGTGDEAVFFCLGPGSITGSTNINDNQWHHIAAVYDGTKMYLYVDGRLDASQTASGSLYVSAANVYIGGSPSQSFNGLIDDVRVYNRALSKDEIETLYFGPVTDLVSDYNIDFKDFAVLGEHWQEDARHP